MLGGFGIIWVLMGLGCWVGLVVVVDGFCFVGWFGGLFVWVWAVGLVVGCVLMVCGFGVLFLGRICCVGFVCGWRWVVVSILEWYGS